MAISDIYSSGVHKRNLGHFANIVRLALSDNQITENEQEILMKLKRSLQIGDVDFKKIMASPNDYPINPPISLNRRLERFYNLLSIINADFEITNEEIVILKRIAIGLGFAVENIDDLVETAIVLILKNISQEEFVESMKKKPKH